MIILVRDTNGTERAINLAQESWEAEAIAGDESKVGLIIGSMDPIVIERLHYDKIKSDLVLNGDILDLT